MLSLAPMGSGQGEYYLSLATEDYYLQGGEPPGRWIGEGAETRQLTGIVDKEAFRHLFQGKDADGTKLVQSAGHESHRPGWDLTFSAPKSVSVLWSQVDSETRQLLQSLHFQAVQKSMGYLEEAAVCRTGKGGHTEVKAKLFVATFEHGTSRAQDPQLHTHCLVLNMGMCEDKKIRTLESKPFFEHKMVAGALYRLELSRLLQEHLGLDIEKHKTWFEVTGVAPSLIEAFSTRRKEIEALLLAKGYESAEASAIAALATREVKGHVAREELFTKWQEIGNHHGWSQQEALTLLHQRRPERDTEIAALAAIHRATEKIMTRNSYFSERELLRTAAEEAVGQSVSVDALCTAMKEQLSRGAQYVSLGMQGRNVLYTTREMLYVEEQMMKRVAQSRANGSHILKEATVFHAAAEIEAQTGRTMNPEQKAALHHITSTTGSIALVSGKAGTGKTMMLEAARLAWENNGYTVLGAALAGKAAEGLESDAGIKSSTLAALLYRIKEKRIALNKDTILVVDEAGMLDTRLMNRVVEEVEKAGAKLVLVGDARQLQPIAAGGPFLAMERELGAAELSTIHRQKQEWMVQAVLDVEQGKGRKALMAYVEAGYMKVKEDRTSAREALIGDWQKEGVENAKQNLIIAPENMEATILNRMAQEERKTAGQLGERHVRVGGETLFEGDRILFTQNSNIYRVKNGHLATVKNVSAERNMLTAELDNGRRVTIPLDAYDEIKLGYAVTTHKAQGATVENAYLMVGGSMQDLHQSYVQLSRAQHTARLYTTKQEAGEHLSTLANQMSELRQKELAQEILKRQQEQTIQPTF